MKKSLLVIPFVLTSFLSANIQADRAEMMRVDRELFIANKQVQLLQEQLAVEKNKHFNMGRVNAYVRTIKEYQAKALKIAQEKNLLVQKQQAYERKMKALERQIPSLSGDVFVKIDISDQVMNIYKGDTLVYSWFVSTAADEYFTPTGNFKPYHTEKMHFSKQWDNSPMPYSVFFKDGFAIHGTEYVNTLGYKMSHGCVRLHPTNAQKLYNLVLQHGYNRTFIKIDS